MAIAQTVDVNVGIEVIEEVVVRGREQEACTGACTEFANVERQHLREGAIEDGGELVREQERSAAVEGEGEAEPIALTVRKFTGPTQQQTGLGQSARGETVESLFDAAGQAVHQREIRQFERRGVESAELLTDGAEQRGFPAAGGSGEQDEVAGLKVQVNLVGYGVRRFVVGEAEEIGYLAGGQSARRGTETVADRDGFHCGLQK